MLFKTKKPHYETLRNKWVKKHRGLSEKFFDKHGALTKRLALTGVGSMMLLGAPAGAMQVDHLLTSGAGTIEKDTDNNALLAESLKPIVPEEPRVLTLEEEEKITSTLTESLGFPVKAEIDNKRLNRSYGVIGGEQHLYRYPGDTLEGHADNAQDWAMYGGSGIAPGLGAWGYFAPSQAAFTEKDKERERYYLAVQTFLSPGFSERVGEYRDFYKFRKMVVINPKTGQAVVAVIGDAGPAAWTGKHLGGSPEVMHYVGHAKGPRKGPVLYYFIDDPEDKVPLGPLKIKGKQSLAKS